MAEIGRPGRGGGRGCRHHAVTVYVDHNHSCWACSARSRPRWRAAMRTDVGFCRTSVFMIPRLIQVIKLLTVNVTSLICYQHLRVRSVNFPAVCRLIHRSPTMTEASTVKRPAVSNPIPTAFLPPPTPYRARAVQRRARSLECVGVNNCMRPMAASVVRHAGCSVQADCSSKFTVNRCL